MQFLDRAWTYTVWTAFVLMAAIWTVMWYDRSPMLGVLQAGLIVHALWQSSRKDP